MYHCLTHAPCPLQSGQDHHHLHCLTLCQRNQAHPPLRVARPLGILVHYSFLPSILTSNRKPILHEAEDWRIIGDFDKIPANPNRKTSSLSFRSTERALGLKHCLEQHGREVMVRIHPVFISDSGRVPRSSLQKRNLPGFPSFAHVFAGGSFVNWSLRFNRGYW